MKTACYFVVSQRMRPLRRHPLRPSLPWTYPTDSFHPRYQALSQSCRCSTRKTQEPPAKYWNSSQSAPWSQQPYLQWDSVSIRCSWHTGGSRVCDSSVWGRRIYSRLYSFIACSLAHRRVLPVWRACLHPCIHRGRCASSRQEDLHSRFGHWWWGKLLTESCGSFAHVLARATCCCYRLTKYLRERLKFGRDCSLLQIWLAELALLLGFRPWPKVPEQLIPQVSFLEQ